MMGMLIVSDMTRHYLMMGMLIVSLMLDWTTFHKAFVLIKMSLALCKSVLQDVDTQ